MAYFKVSRVKYLLDPPTPPLHNLQDFEFKTAMVRHSSFKELVTGVLLACPQGYRCLRPIALHHELVWGQREEDRLFQPLFEVLAL
jgi:hypothetical protein